MHNTVKHIHDVQINSEVITFLSLCQEFSSGCGLIYFTFGRKPWSRN